MSEQGAAMALGFFRRRQKMIFIIMAFLMVGFLIGIPGFEAIFGIGGGDVVLGHLAGGAKLKRSDLLTAEQDLNVLDALRLDGLMRSPAGGRLLAAWPTGEQYIALRMANASGELNAAHAFAVLLKEAEQAGVKMVRREVEVKSFLAEAGWTGRQYEQLLAQIRQQMRISESRVFEALGRWLTVQRHFAACQVQVPPSEPQLRRLYRDLTERIDLLVARLPAEKFLGQVGEPTEKEIQDQFEAYRSVPLDGRYPSLASFGFSYRQPPRVSLVALFFPRQVIEQVTHVTPQEALQYYREHKQERPFQKPATQPASQPAEQEAADTQPQQPTVQMDFDEARDIAVELRKAQKVNDTARSLAERAEKLIAQFTASQQPSEKPSADAYARTLQAMIMPAEQALSKKIDVNIDKEPLSSAIARLEDASGTRICYPWGRHGDYSLDPSVVVSMSLEGATLGQALEQITDQVKLPKLQWARCQGVEGAIFPISGVEVFPVTLLRSGMADLQAVAEHEVFGRSYIDARGTQPLALLAFGAEEISQAEGPRPGAMKDGDDGPRMFVLDRANEGLLLWRLEKAVPGYEPQQLTDDLRRQVAQDLKTLRAFDLAGEAARQLEKQALQTGLAAAATQAGVETLETGPFARKGFQPPTLRTLLFYQLLGGPLEFDLNDLPKLPRLPTEKNGDSLREQVLQRVFTLAPANVEPPYPDQPPAIELLLLPPIGEALVIQRIDYRPPVAHEYQAISQELASHLLAMRRWQTQMEWFKLEDALQRTGFKPDRP